MPSGVVKERRFDLVPEGWYRARLLDVTERQLNGATNRLRWKWEIIEDDADTGVWIWGSCWAELDQSDRCAWRRWHEALIEHEVDIGGQVDTDDVLGLTAYVRVSHESYWPKAIADAERTPANEANMRTVAKILDDDVEGVMGETDFLEKVAVGEIELGQLGDYQPPQRSESKGWAGTDPYADVPPPSEPPPDYF